MHRNIIEQERASSEVRELIKEYDGIVDDGGVVSLDIPGDERKIKVDAEYKDVIESLLENTPSLVESIIAALDQTGDDELTFVNEDLPDGVLASVYPHRATISMDYEMIEIYAEALYEYQGNDWEELSPEEKKEAESQMLASVITHEIGHLNGSLKHCCEDGELKADHHHGPEHSMYTMGVMNEWIDNTDQTPYYDFEAGDYSHDSFFDRDEVLSKLFIPETGGITTLESQYDKILKALDAGDHAEVTSLLDDIPEDMMIEREWENPQENRPDGITNTSAKNYIMSLLLYETFDVSGLGGSDEGQPLEEDERL